MTDILELMKNETNEFCVYMDFYRKDEERPFKIFISNSNIFGLNEFLFASYEPTENSYKNCIQDYFKLVDNLITNINDLKYTDVMQLFNSSTIME